MNPSTTAAPSSFLTLKRADRVGVVASILCAIHCAIAPILLIALPAFGRVWAHPASHILVAILVVPIAVFSIRKGYRTHKNHGILVTASIGILLVLVGAMLPALTPADGDLGLVSIEAGSEITPEHSASALAEPCESACADEVCDSTAGEGDPTPAAGCVDNCCPSLQVNEVGETSLHIPHAAIVTTLGGLFLIVAHIGNLCSCGHACRASQCVDCG